MWKTNKESWTLRLWWTYHQGASHGSWGKGWSWHSRMFVAHSEHLNTLRNWPAHWRRPDHRLCHYEWGKIQYCMLNYLLLCQKYLWPKSQWNPTIRKYRKPSMSILCSRSSIRFICSWFICLFTGIKEENIWFLDPLLYSQEDSTYTS